MKKVACGCFIALILAYFPASFQSTVSSAEAEDLHIVLLKDLSVAEKVMEWVPEEVMEFRQTSLRGPAARRYQDSIRHSQGRFVDTVLSRRIKVLDRCSFLLNMLLVRGSRKEIEELGRQEEVKGVYPNPKRFLLMDAAPTVVGASDFWFEVGGRYGPGT